MPDPFTYPQHHDFRTTMNFRESQPIYLQIAERLMDEILAGKYAPDERIPGVRDYSILLQVNVNTTTKAFDRLRQRGIIYDKRGLGCFVSPDAMQQILDLRRATFFNEWIPDIAHAIRQLGITNNELLSHIEAVQSKDAAAPTESSN